jgi:hypothetical protein
MAFLSSFELLFEPITPKTGAPINPGSGVPDPVIVQAYFALISNVGPNPVDLKLSFTSTLPLFGSAITIFDIANTSFSSKPIPAPSGGVNTVDLGVLSPTETGLFLLQPDVASLLSTLSTPNDINSAKFAARGYVEVTGTSAAGTQCLITPQTRGTFLNQTSVSPVNLTVISQEAYALPVPAGNLFKF